MVVSSVGMEMSKSPVPVAESVSSLSSPNALEHPSSNTQARGQAAEALRDITCGSFAGIIGKYVEYPFDTIKVRLQSQPDHLPLQYTGPLDCFKKSLQQDGFLGIYRGVSAPLFGSAIDASCMFFSYRLAQEAFRATLYPQSECRKELPVPAMLCCGAISGAFTSMFLTPIELVKCKMQVPLEATKGSVRQPGVLSIIAFVYRHQGALGFWHGQLGTFIRETGGGAAWFGGNELMKAQFRRLNQRRGAAPDAELSVHQELISGAIGGMAYNFLCFPADTIKSRMQTEDIRQVTGGRSTFNAVAKALWRQHGLRGLYRGCGITVARAAPSNAIIFTLYAQLEKRWPW